MRPILLLLLGAAALAAGCTTAAPEEAAERASMQTTDGEPLARPPAAPGDAPAASQASATTPAAGAGAPAAGDETSGNAGDAGAAPVPEAEPVTVDVIEVGPAGFSHPDVTVPLGTTVTWRNVDPNYTHSVIAEGGHFSSGELMDEGTYAFRFHAVGVYPYHCGMHPEMTGTITVTRT